MLIPCRFSGPVAALDGQRFFTSFRMTGVILSVSEGSGYIQICRQSNTKKIGKSDFAMIDQFGLRERLVPFLG